MYMKKQNKITGRTTEAKRNLLAEIGDALMTAG